MARTHRQYKLDANHREILAGLRAAGIVAYSIASAGDGIPDIIAGKAGVNYLLEVKGGMAKPTRKEAQFALTWPGQYAIVRNLDEALRTMRRRQ